MRILHQFLEFRRALPDCEKVFVNRLFRQMEFTGYLKCVPTVEPKKGRMVEIVAAHMVRTTRHATAHVM
ncbi:hypothetical protein I6H96_02670 [Brucella anthropi]|uniref:hypothetical protein n=1 Tax=Brucella anthropi TaxID=529 RepID=UPI0002F3C920|nr:hypothetical protein [Brucella anthropi]QQC25784.1 hypothetical protein I6H96_02670 [Brucella anthropi]